MCDGNPQCVNTADENFCSHNLTELATFYDPPATVNIREDNVFIYTKVQRSQNISPCQGTHFQCPENGFCLPLVMRCNGVNDCPGHEDEHNCKRRQCPGLFRCHSSVVCLPLISVCDGVFHCPQRDDEVLCDAVCPPECTCVGLALFCKTAFPVSNYSQLRYLHARGSGLKMSDVENNTMIIYLSLSQCGIWNLHGSNLPLLHSLDVSDNSLLHITMKQLNRWSHLRSLSLAGNPLMVKSLAQKDGIPHTSLLFIDLSRIQIFELNMSMFSLFPNLQMLNMSDCRTVKISRSKPLILGHLKSVDFRGSPVNTMPKDLFEGLSHLQQVFADNYKLCCPGVLPPGFDTDHCSATFNEVSSCEALLKSDVYRIFLSVFSFFTLIGNFGSFGIRMFVEKNALKSSFTVFVIHLCVSDFMMGVYLAVIGISDRFYLGTYLWEEYTWRQSHVCKMAGFLGLLSCEVSAFLICLITLDRFLVLRFPFSPLHFSSWSSQVVTCTVWLVGLVLAVFPLLPMTSHWQFYSQTGTCLPLPVTTADFAGHTYSFGVMIILNFILFLLIALGQASIYISIRANAMATMDSTRKARDVSIARRLITIAVTDFLCWFPIGVLGLLAIDDISISGEVNVSMAICVLPVNSAINPFLYTLNLLLEKRRKKREEQLFEQLNAVKTET